MIFAVAALIAWNVATQLLSARREQRLVDALMARNAGEYALIRKADKAPPAKKRAPVDPEEPTGFTVGLS